MDAQDRSVRLTIPAKAEYITLGRLALTAIARVRPLSQETLSDLKLALTEAAPTRYVTPTGKGGQARSRSSTRSSPTGWSSKLPPMGGGSSPPSSQVAATAT